MSVKEMKALAVEVLEKQVDDSIGKSGFKRSTKGLLYRRKKGRLLQMVLVNVQRPNTYPDNMALIQAFVRCESATIGEHVLKLVRGRKDIFRGTHARIFNIPAGFWRERRNAIIWTPQDPSSWDAFGSELADILTQIVLPVFDSFSSLPRLVQGYRENDARLMARSPKPVQIAAAFIVAGDSEGARAFLLGRLALPQIRKHERKLIERILPRI